MLQTSLEDLIIKILLMLMGYTILLMGNTVEIAGGVTLIPGILHTIVCYSDKHSNNGQKSSVIQIPTLH